MRHRKRGRRLGRSASHRRAMLRNLASSLFLTERDAELDENAPKVQGRIVTTVHKAKEVRPLVEKCITIARQSLRHSEEAEQYATDAERGSEEWRDWRNSDQWQQWNQAIAPTVAARRRALRLLGSKQAVRILFDDVAPRFADRNGGYTRILKLAAPRLGDAGSRAILEFVGQHDRVIVHSEKPEFGGDEQDAEDKLDSEVEEELLEDQDQVTGDDAAEEQPVDEAAEESASEEPGDEDDDKKEGEK